MALNSKDIIFFVVFFIVGSAASFAVLHVAHGSTDSVSKDVDDLRDSLTMLDANVRILTETLTAYEEELKLCRARPFCQDRVVETLEKQDVPSHPASDEVDNANP